MLPEDNRRAHSSCNADRGVPRRRARVGGLRKRRQDRPAPGGGDRVTACGAEPPATDLTITVRPPASGDLDTEQYDPRESFNEKMFTFNYNVDKYALKPVARGYRSVVPEQVQIMLSNAFNNVTWVPRFINSVLQGKWEGALREVSRFVLNSTLGIGGLFAPGPAPPP